MDESNCQQPLAVPNPANPSLGCDVFSTQMPEQVHRYAADEFSNVGRSNPNCLSIVFKAMATIPPIIMAARMIGTHARTRWRVPLSSKPTSCQNVRDVSKDDKKKHNAETIWLFRSVWPAS